MPQIEEARLRQLEEAHGRVPTLESERDTAVTRAETAEGRADTAEARVAELEEAAAVRERTDRASAIITERATEAGVTFTALEARGLSADLPLTSEGALDEDAFATTVDEAAAEKATHSGAGRPRGVTGRKPGEAGDADVSESDVTDMIRRRAGLEQKGA